MKFQNVQALKKAEEVLKKKQDKKDKAVCFSSFLKGNIPPLQGPKTVANKYGSREATASQVITTSL